MWDTDLFLWLNFEGGAFIDSVMQFASGKLSWVPLYLLILWLIWRQIGWKGVVFAIIAIGGAVAIADMISGIFKHTGVFKSLLPDFPVRLRPMHTPELKGLINDITGGGLYGTVSAHAATSISIGLISTLAIRRRWFSIIMWTQVLLVCYSRIYLSCHFPQDILLGAAVGIVSGGAMWLLLKNRIRNAR